MIKLLIFGDSIAWGLFDLEKGGWVNRLTTYYINQFSDNTKTKVGVYNFASSTNNTRGVLNSLENSIKDVNFIKKDEMVLLFSIGLNDARYYDDKNNYLMTDKEFIKNINKLIKLSKKHSNKIFFTGLIKTNDELTKPWLDTEHWETADVKKFNDIIKKVCQEQKIEFIDIYSLLDNSDLYDGLHPNTQGQIKIYNKIQKYLDTSLDLTK